MSSRMQLDVSVFVSFLCNQFTRLLTDSNNTFRCFVNRLLAALDQWSHLHY